MHEQQPRKIPDRHIRLWYWSLEEIPAGVPRKDQCYRIDMPVEQYGAMSKKMILIKETTNVGERKLCVRGQPVEWTECL
jgi:hypothetical protein